MGCHERKRKHDKCLAKIAVSTLGVSLMGRYLRGRSGEKPKAIHTKHVKNQLTIKPCGKTRTSL